jgi:hypothetical protein
MSGRIRPIVPTPGKPVSLADVTPPRAWDHMTLEQRIGTIVEREGRRMVAKAERRQRLQRVIGVRPQLPQENWGIRITVNRRQGG